MIRKLLVLAAVLLPAACGNEGTTPPEQTGIPTPSLSKYALAKDPGKALSVALVRKQASSKGEEKELVVVGRVRTLVKGYASFQIIDDSLNFCGQTGEEDCCSTPWDYCCIANDEQASHTILVEAHGPDGRVIPAPSIEGLRLLDLVAVAGKVKRDGHGNVIVVASGWYRRERPTLREGLDWPK